MIDHQVDSVELTFDLLRERYYIGDNTWIPIDCTSSQTSHQQWEEDERYVEEALAYRTSLIPDNILYIGRDCVKSPCSKVCKEDRPTTCFKINNWAERITSYRELNKLRQRIEQKYGVDIGPWYYLGVYYNGYGMSRHLMQICDNQVISEDCLDEVNIWVPKTIDPDDYEYNRRYRNEGSC